jgi:hypothetical protein
MARPLGPIAQTILQLVRERGPLPARTLAHDMDISVRAATHTCWNLVQSGHICVVNASRMDRARRPLQHFGLPGPQGMPVGVDIEPFQLAAIWR